MRIDGSWKLKVLDFSYVNPHVLQQFGIGGSRLEYWERETELHAYRFAPDRLYELMSCGARSYSDYCRCCNACCRVLHQTKVKKAWGELWKCSGNGCLVGWWGNSGSLPADTYVRGKRKQLMDVYSKIKNKGSAVSLPSSIGVMNAAECVFFKLKLVAEAYSQSMIDSLSSTEQELIQMWHDDKIDFMDDVIRIHAPADTAAGASAIVKINILGLQSMLSPSSAYSVKVDRVEMVEQRIVQSTGRLIDLD